MINQTVEELLSYHLDKYPKAEPRDFYKMLYQGVFGVSHIISSKAREYLDEEAKRVDLEDYLNRSLLEPVSPDGRMVRVYLRPFMRMGLDLDKLFNVMQRSAMIKGEESRFRVYWSVFELMVESGKLSLDEKLIEEVNMRIRVEGIIPMHHTPRYRDAYYPAYRVVWKPYFDESFGDL